MEQEANREQKISITADVSKDHSPCEYTAGPLNINRQIKLVKTVMGTDIILGDHDFEALDLLVSNENEYLSFQQLYEASWSKSPSTDSIDYAFSALNNIMIQINNAGEDFMWIENKPGAGYAFKTRWGQTWRNNNANANSETLLTDSLNNTENKREYEKRRLTKTTLLTGAGTLVAAIILVLVVLYTTGVITPTTAEPLYIDEIDIEDPNTPLAGPGFEE